MTGIPPSAPGTHATLLRTSSGSSCRWLRMIPSLGTIPASYCRWRVRRHPCQVNVFICSLQPHSWLRPHQGGTERRLPRAPRTEPRRRCHRDRRFGGILPVVDHRQDELTAPHGVEAQLQGVREHLCGWRIFWNGRTEPLLSCLHNERTLHETRNDWLCRGARPRQLCRVRSERWWWCSWRWGNIWRRGRHVWLERDRDNRQPGIQQHEQQHQRLR